MSSLKPPAALLLGPEFELVPITDANVDDLHSLFLNAEVRRYLLDGLEMDRDWVSQIVVESATQFECQGTGLWGIWPVGPGLRTELVGVVGLREFFEPPRMQLIFALSPSVWGQRLAVKASTRILEYLADELSWVRVEAATDPPNTASIRVLERLGFQRFLPDVSSRLSEEFGETLFYELCHGSKEIDRQ